MRDSLVDLLKKAGLSPEELIESRAEITVRDQLRMQQAIQEFYCDNAISYTVTMTKGSVSGQELAKELRYRLRSLKGTTLMPIESRPQMPYVAITENMYDQATNTSVGQVDQGECAHGACPIK